MVPPLGSTADCTRTRKNKLDDWSIENLQTETEKKWIKNNRAELLRSLRQFQKDLYTQNWNNRGRGKTIWRRDVLGNNG